MPLAPETRISILNRAVELESHSFVEYLAHTAPPVDIDRHPRAKALLHEIAHEEDVVVEELVDLLEQQGTHADTLKTYDPAFTAYNYVTTAYALKVTREKLSQSLARIDALLVEARGDSIEPLLAALRTRTADQIARLEATAKALGAPHAAPDASGSKPAAHH